MCGCWLEKDKATQPTRLKATLGRGLYKNKWRDDASGHKFFSRFVFYLIKGQGSPPRYTISRYSFKMMNICFHKPIVPRKHQIITISNKIHLPHILPLLALYTSGQLRYRTPLGQRSRTGASEPKQIKDPHRVSIDKFLFNNQLLS